MTKAETQQAAIKSIFLILVGCAFIIGISSIPYSGRSTLWGPQIDQVVVPERDGLNEVKTYVWINGRIATAFYSSDRYGIDIGVPKDQVDKEKLLQLIDARNYLETYKKNKY